MTDNMETLLAEIRATLDGIKADNAASNRRVELCARNVWSVEELALYLGVSVDRASRMAKARLFPSYKQNGRYFFRRAEIEAWQTADRIASADEFASAAAKRSIKNRR